MEEKESTFADRLIQVMNINGVRAVDVSRATGISKSLLSKYLKGSSVATTKNIDALCKYFNVSYAWLLGFAAPMRRLDKELKHDETGILISICQRLDLESVRKILDYARMIEKLKENEKK